MRRVYRLVVVACALLFIGAPLAIEPQSFSYLSLQELRDLRGNNSGNWKEDQTYCGQVTAVQLGNGPPPNMNFTGNQNCTAAFEGKTCIFCSEDDGGWVSTLNDNGGPEQDLNGAKNCANCPRFDAKCEYDEEEDSYYCDLTNSVRNGNCLSSYNLFKNQPVGP